MEIQAKDVFKKYGESSYLLALNGNKDAVIKGVNSYESGGVEDLVVIPNKQAFEKLNGKVFGAIVIPKDLAENISGVPSGTGFARSSSVSASTQVRDVASAEGVPNDLVRVLVTMVSWLISLPPRAWSPMIFSLRPSSNTST